MGGKNPAVVLDDAENLDRVAAHIVNGAFWNMGENCSASSRLIVQKGVKDDLLKRIVAHAREWPMGDPLDPVNRVGALVSKGITTRSAATWRRAPRSFSAARPTRVSSNRRSLRSPAMPSRPRRNLWPRPLGPDRRQL
jgi:acyl-CoA reductase-like NAD-dependent aldehyde dehydrogenase